MIGYAMCGSFCTLRRSLVVMKKLKESGEEIQPIMSEIVYHTDTRFGRAEAFREEVTAICGREIIHTITAAERLGPAEPLDALVIAPCTGNTLAKLASGITDTAVTMAAKAHLRSDRPLLIALASNDAMSQNLASIARLLTRRSVYLVPMLQDDPRGKPHSLVAEMSLVPECLGLLEHSEQKRPLFLTPGGGE